MGYPNRASRWPGLLLALAIAATRAAVAQSPTIPLRINGHEVQAEVAHTPQTRGLGLMYRKALPENRGMLFVYREPGYHAMWMVNTVIPLSVAFLDERGVILNIRDMRPLSEDAHTAADLAGYALEMNAGWFRSRGIGPGARIEGLSAAPKGE